MFYFNQLRIAGDRHCFFSQHYYEDHSVISLLTKNTNNEIL